MTALARATEAALWRAGSMWLCRACRTAEAVSWTSHAGALSSRGRCIHNCHRDGSFSLPLQRSTQAASTVRRYAAVPGNSVPPPPFDSRPAAAPFAARREHELSVRSFLLGSSFDLQQLRAKFRDVVRAQGKDYLVLGIRAFEHVNYALPIENGNAEAAFDTDAEDPGLAELPPDDTYLVVFRYGAVVLFQGAAEGPDPCSLPTVLWDTSTSEWQAALAKEDDARFIYLLLRPFLRDMQDSMQLHDIMNMEAPSPLRGLDLSRTHTLIKPSEDGRLSDAMLNRPLMYNENVRLTIRPSQDPFIIQKPDMFYVKQLDVGVLRCIGSALGQSCALDYYSSKVDAALQLAQNANLMMMQTGVFKASLNFKQIIGYLSLIHGSVISQLGLLDKNDLAWHYAKYDKLVELMRVEFELDKRIQNLQDKIGVVARDAATFISFQQNDKSTMLEWAVVILILTEIIVGLVDIGLQLNGHG